MKTIAEELEDNSKLLLTEEVDLNWTTKLNYSDDEATAVCENLFDEYEQLDGYTEKEAKHLATMIESLFIEKSENYWACKARLNALASRLHKKEKVVSSDDGISSYPVPLEKLPDHLYGIDSTHALFDVGRVAREWMINQLRKEGQLTFKDESAVLNAVERVLASFNQLWKDFTSIQSYDEWQSVMTQLGLATFYQTKAIYEHFKASQPWNSLTLYQQSLKDELVKSYFMNSDEITTHSTETSSFMDGLYPTDWLKIQR